MKAFLFRSTLLVCLTFAFAAFASAQTAAEFFKRGYNASQANDFPTAIAEYSNAIQTDPSHTSAYYNRAIAYQRRGDRDLAILDYTKAIQLDPKKTEAYINRANLYSDMGSTALAIADYSKVIELEPAHANAYFNRGFAYKRQKMYTEALADYDRSIGLDRKVAKVHYMRATLNVVMANFADAVRDFDTAESLGYDPANIRHLRAWAFLFNGQNDRAHAEVVEYFAKTPPKDRSPAVAAVGYLALRRKGDSVAANALLRDVSSKVDHSPISAAIYKFLLGEMPEEAFLEVTKERKHLAVGHGYVGEMYLLAGDANSAAEHFKWVAENGDKLLSEYLLAVAELRLLANK